MPFLRFSKDRRGYESTFLLHADRAAERDAPLLLYWFRTPPHVKMGRAALDEETIRVLEDTHPSVDFDWPRILAARPQPSEPPPDASRPPRPRRRTEREDRGHARPARPAAPVPGVPAASAAPRPAPEPEEMDAPPPSQAARIDSPPPAHVPSVPSQPDEPEAPARKFTRIFDAPAGEVPVEPGSPAGPTPETGRLSEPSASDRALGSEELERLRGRYAAVMARIARRVAEPSLGERLRAIAERANPDNWVTADDVKAGLLGLDDVYAQLVPHVGRRRRRRRSGRRGPSDSSPVTPDAASRGEFAASRDASPDAEGDDQDAQDDEGEDEEESPESGG